jgi:low affinity Fe/Cu permease
MRSTTRASLAMAAAAVALVAIFGIAAAFGHEWISMVLLLTGAAVSVCFTIVALVTWASDRHSRDTAALAERVKAMETRIASMDTNLGAVKGLLTEAMNDVRETGYAEGLVNGTRQSRNVTSLRRS